MDDTLDPRTRRALARYQVISAFLALAPARGDRQRLRTELASRTFTDEHGEPFTVSAETIRRWVRCYERQGLDGLMDKPRAARGTAALSEQAVETACALKREVPERSLERLIAIMEAMGHVPAGSVRRSTLHRALQARGLSARKARPADSADLDRFEADFPNDLWQSDMLSGPLLPDPKHPTKSRRAWLYAFIDDHSRLLLDGRFSFKGDLPALELCMRRALQKHGLPRRCYYDNGQVYHSGHMRHIVATLGLHRVVYTQAYRPMGHGKIEAFNRLVRNSFLSELRASRITTLDGLNEAFLAWADLDYNRAVHSTTGETPIARWKRGIDKLRYAEEERLRVAFLWREPRKADKTGLFSLFGVTYQVGAALCGKSVEVRYDPERLDEVEVWSGGRFVERTRPFHVSTHRRPRVKPPAEPTAPAAAAAAARPTADWLGHLVARRRKERFGEPEPREVFAQARAQRAAADDAIVALLATLLDPQAMDETAIREWLARFGPLDPDHAKAVLEARFAQGEPRDHHPTVYLDAIRNTAPGATR